MRIVAISDTHTMHDRLTIPDGDVLVHAGDLCGNGTVLEVERFDKFLSRLPHTHKVVIAGNHDWCFARDPVIARAALVHGTYLEDSGVELDGVRFWGSPWQPEFMQWAFNLPLGEALRAKWALIPDGTDVLITHGPPRGYGDRCFDGREVGCPDLLAAIDRLQPAAHICGHIHEGYGVRARGRTQCVNASSCDLRYRPIQAPIIIDL